MARICQPITGLVVLSIGMTGGAAPAIKMNQQDAGDGSNGMPSGQVVRMDKDKVENGLTVKYLEFDLARDPALFAAISHELQKHRDDMELVQQLRRGAKLLKELQTVVPLTPGRASEGIDPVGSMLRVKLTSVAVQGPTYAIKADFERWDRGNGALEFTFTWGIRQQELNLKPGTWQVASIHTHSVLNTKTNKMEIQKLMLWIVYLRNDGLVESNVRVRNSPLI